MKFLDKFVETDEHEATECVLYECDVSTGGGAGEDDGECKHVEDDRAGEDDGSRENDSAGEDDSGNEVAMALV